MWAIFRPIQNYEKTCEYNATVVQPDPMFVIGMNKKKSSRVGPDPVLVTERIKKRSSQVGPNPMPITGRIKTKSSRVGKKGSSHPPPLPLTPAMNYVTPSPPINIVQPDLVPVIGRNMNVVQPYPVPVTGSIKKESSQVRLDLVSVPGRIKRKSSQVEKKSSYLPPPPMPSTPAMNYVAPPPPSVINVNQSDPMPVTGRNMNVVKPDRVPVTRKIKKKSSRVGKKSSSLPPLPSTSAINDIVPPPLMPAMNVVQSDPMPVIGKNMNVVQPDPVPVIGKNKKKSSRIKKMGSFLPTPLSPAPDINYVAPPTPLINNVAAPLPLPSFPSTPIINYIISVPRSGNREVRRWNRNCWDQNRMA